MPRRLEIPAGVTSHVAEIATCFDADTADESVGVTLGFLPSGFEADGNLIRRPAVPAVKADPNADPPVDAVPAIPATPARQTVFVISDIHKSASMPATAEGAPRVDAGAGQGRGLRRRLLESHAWHTRAEQGWEPRLASSGGPTCWLRSYRR